jgi:3-oxoacyl-(acyl-carrier-protein) synthase
MHYDQGKKVFITGIGVISAIGTDVQGNLNALQSKMSGIFHLRHLQTIHKDELLCGEVSLSTQQLIKHLGLEDDCSYPRTTLLAIYAAKEACKDAILSPDPSLKTGVIVGTTVGGMDKSEVHYGNIGKNVDFIHSHHCGYTTERVADYFKAYDFLSSISTACSSGANSILLGARLIKHGILDRVIVGGTDSLSKFTINGFKTLMILNPGHCTPFDEDRMGLNLGEGAGMLVLESEEASKNKKRYASLSGYANSNDAYHQTASSPEGTGPYLSMKNALDEGGLKISDIQYINVHGTGTGNNDLTEGIAIKKLFGEQVPMFSSTKAFTGHTLGASGAIEAVYSVLAIDRDMIFPNLNFKNPIHEVGLIPETELLRQTGVKNVMSNSFGFGGNDTTLIFSKI